MWTTWDRREKKEGWLNKEAWLEGETHENKKQEELELNGEEEKG